MLAHAARNVKVTQVLVLGLSSFTIRVGSVFVGINTMQDAKRIDCVR